MAARLNASVRQPASIYGRSRNRHRGLIACAFAVVLAACDAPDTAQEAADHGQPDVWAQARDQGVDFRGVGNEPGWVLEIREHESVVLSADYGSSRYQIERAENAVDPVSGGRLLRSAGAPVGFEVILIDQPCHDDMSGEAFPTVVLVRMGGQQLRGCGRALGAGR